ncbi:serine hydrolase domain-containing protein [Thalassotalea montiporae]
MNKSNYQCPIRALFIAIALTATSATAIATQTDSTENANIRAFEHGLIDYMKRGQEDKKPQSINKRMLAYQVPGVSVAIIKNGKLLRSTGYGTRLNGKTLPVDADTVFSVGSVSKIINAALILRLVAAGKLDLDKNIDDYLTSWQVPNSSFTHAHPVTLRQILAHTAGFNQHGFADFQPGERLPTTLQTLNGQSPAKHGAIKLMFAPGSKMDYSGGGITVSQLIVEEITGLTYPKAAEKYVFKPLSMQRSTFQNPLPENYGNIAYAHDDKGRPAAQPRGYEAMPEMAASGLWTSANDLAKFVIALLNSSMSENGFLPKPIAADMMTRVTNSWHGLGPRLNGKGKTRVFHHGGANQSYRAWIEGHLASGDGIVVLTNGTNGHWIYRELRKSAEDAFAWPVRDDGGLEEPEFTQ